MTTRNRKKGQLRLIFLAAAALGSSSAAMSGVLASLTIDQQANARATMA